MHFPNISQKCSLKIALLKNTFSKLLSKKTYFQNYSPKKDIFKFTSSKKYIFKIALSKKNRLTGVLYQTHKKKKNH